MVDHTWMRHKTRKITLHRLHRLHGHSTMNTSLNFLARLAFISGVLAVSAPAMAHRSGCHRWHSCPSDTGSYVCGDTGHSNECGRSEATSPPRKSAHHSAQNKNQPPIRSRPAPLPSR
jgi:hypothetical protein